MDILDIGIYVFLLPINIIGNSLVCFLFRKVNGNCNFNITNHLLLNLAVSDLLSGCVILVCKIVISSVETTNDLYCKIVGTSLYLTNGVSVLTLMVIAIERHYSIMKPALHLYYTRDRRSRRVIYLIWLVSTVLATPLVAFFRSVEFADRRVTICGIVSSGAAKAGPIYDTFVIMALFLIPHLVIFLLYARIILNLWFYPRLRPQSHQAVLRSRRRYTKMLVIVTVVFSICWFPYYFRTVRALVLSENSYALSTACRVLVLLNSCADPVIYTLYSARFRRRLKQLCRCRSIRPSRKVAASQVSRPGQYDVTGAISSLQLLPYLISITHAESDLHTQNRRD